MSIWDYNPTSSASRSVRDCISEARRHAIENGANGSGSMELRIELEPGDMGEARTLGEVRFENDRWWLFYVVDPATKIREAVMGEAALGGIQDAYDTASSASRSVHDCIDEARQSAIANGMNGSMALRIELEPGDMDEARTLGRVRFEAGRWWLLYVEHWDEP